MQLSQYKWLDNQYIFYMADYDEWAEQNWLLALMIHFQNETSFSLAKKDAASFFSCILYRKIMCWCWGSILQLPALILPGITLVVSPLVALMVDQLRRLPPMLPGGLLCSNQVIEKSVFVCGCTCVQADVHSFIVCVCCCFFFTSVSLLELIICFCFRQLMRLLGL